ncbi:mucin-5B-like [Pelobates fuscus]|uniref:mucin-5B-like n=1 Tax=Pelobates fuscus TaxID=191477 RepID=UPI002FE4725B
MENKKEKGDKMRKWAKEWDADRPNAKCEEVQHRFKESNSREHFKFLSVHKPDEIKPHCSTWGNSHFKTFDGNTLTFPGTCYYIFASHCHSSYPEFDIKIQRVITEEFNRVYFTVMIEGIITKITEEGITVNGEQISLPYSKGNIFVDDTCENFKITSRIGVTLTWNWGDDLKLELDDQYKEQTCGLCGNYDNDASNDVSWRDYNVSNRMISSDSGNLDINGTYDYEHKPRQINMKRKERYLIVLHLILSSPVPPFTRRFSVSTIMFGNLQKINAPMEDCPDVPNIQNDEMVQDACQEKSKECEDLLSYMGNCKEQLGSYADYLNACKKDLCECASKNKTMCICSTLNQFSKECVLAETVLDDVNHRKECVKRRQCPCVHSGKIYNPGESYSTACQNCLCILGQWACTQLPCSGNCSLKGGSHISTFDEKEYTFHGNCQYVISKDVNKRFAVIGKIVQCGMSETITCLNTVYINIGIMKIKICYCGNVYINNFITLLPKIKDGIIIYKPSSYFINVVTPFGMSVQVQIKPVFQLFITVNSTFQDQTNGLCGNFNGVEADDLKTMSGVVEESASAFSNSWKVQASCSDLPDHFENPCANSISKDEYAQHWCSLLINTTEVFAACHPHIDPFSYLKYCKYDVCNSDHSEDTLCMWLSVYARDCALKGVPLWGWREKVCDPTGSCPETMTFSYNPRPCNFTCRSLSEPDPLCSMPNTPTEGCSCTEGTYMTSNEKCVPPEKCPCSFNGREVPVGHAIKVDELLCKCIRGVLECPKKDEPIKACKHPMYHVSCKSDPDAQGSECQKSCTTQDMQCICSVYGNGHYTTFDGSTFDFSGDCDYVLTQNITIELFEGRVEETNRDFVKDTDLSYTVDVVGLYIVFKTDNGLVLMWDQKTTAIVQLARSFEGTVCGLCGNFDGRSSNDFTSSSNSLEYNENVFAESWKVKQGCKSQEKIESCLMNPKKLPWAEKHCSLIKSIVFAPCHSKVDPIPFYDSCVSDSCSCTEGGDCECLCTSLAAYSSACRRSNICITWRTPDICPLFCDYYNRDGHCEWHYKPCGVPCMKTCTNPMGKCDDQIQQLEGCYPICSRERPYFDENTKRCVPILNCTTCEVGETLCDGKSERLTSTKGGITSNESIPKTIPANVTKSISEFSSPKGSTYSIISHLPTSKNVSYTNLFPTSTAAKMSSARMPSSKRPPSTAQPTALITKETQFNPTSKMSPPYTGVMVTSKISVTNKTAQASTALDFTPTNIQETNITLSSAATHSFPPYTQVLAKTTVEKKKNATTKSTEVPFTEGTSRLLTLQKGILLDPKQCLENVHAV